ncbi:MAG: hypothetical protein ACK4GO_15995 [Gemmobacter sp.]
MQAIAALALGCVAAGAALGYLLARMGRQSIAIGLLSAVLLGGLLLLATAHMRDGMDAMGHVVIAFIFFIPAGIGIAIGLWIGSRRRG